MSLFEELKRRNVIRVSVAYLAMAWVLLQISDLVLENINAPDWVMQAIMLVMAIGFPVVVVFAWAFEMTPDGIKREKDVDRSQSITRQTGRKLDYAIIGILTVAVSYLLVDKFVLPHEGAGPAESTELARAAPTTGESPSVAVLPFVNMSGDAENEYFSDGLTETLLHMLAQIPKLKVAARTSSFAFKGQNISVAEIGQALGVAHILEGSVQKANDRVRVTAQLVRADDGFHMWSQNYTRPLEDIFAIQDEIAEDVAAALGSSLLGSTLPDLHGVSTTDIAAYDSYLRGLEQQALFSYGGLKTAENHFKQALARDPKFVDARLALVRNYALAYSTGLISRDEISTLTQPLIKQALAQEPGNQLAHALELTLELMIFDPSIGVEQIEVKVNELRNLLEFIPTETFSRSVLANKLWGYFRQERDAIEVLQAGIMIDPLDAELHRRLGIIYDDSGRPDEARVELLRSLELSPGNPNNYSELARLEKNAGNLPGYLDWMRQASEVDPQDHELAFHIARDLYLLKLPEEGDQWNARVQALAPGSAIARSLEVRRALAHGAGDEALQLASAAIEDQVEDRQFAFGDIAITYSDLMLRQNKAQEGYEFLVSVRPEITHYDKLAPDLQGMVMQWTSIALMSGFESPENQKSAWNDWTTQLNAMGFPWLADPADELHTWGYLINGDTDKAIDHYLEYRLSLPLAQELDRINKPLYPLFAPVYEDPRVAARLAQDAGRFEQLRGQVQAMLQRPEWN
jgi:TolB-like protein